MKKMTCAIVFCSAITSGCAYSMEEGDDNTHGQYKGFAVLKTAHDRERENNRKGIEQELGTEKTRLANIDASINELGGELLGVKGGSNKIIAKLKAQIAKLLEEKKNQEVCLIKA